MSRGEGPSDGKGCCCKSVKLGLRPLGGGLMRFEIEKGPREGLKFRMLPFGRGEEKLLRDGLKGWEFMSFVRLGVNVFAGRGMVL